MTPDEMLQAIADLKLDQSSTDYDSYKCQFCEFGPLNPFVDPLNPEAGPHLPSCVWLQIDKYLKAISVGANS